MAQIRDYALEANYQRLTRIPTTQHLVVWSLPRCCGLVELCNEGLKLVGSTLAEAVFHDFPVGHFRRRGQVLIFLSNLRTVPRARLSC